MFLISDAYVDCRGVYLQKSFIVDVRLGTRFFLHATELLRAESEI